MQIILFLTVSFFASVIGSICGLGGGVIIKPTIDVFNVIPTSIINFLSSCTVFSMTCYSVFASIKSKQNSLEFDKITPLAIGAALGGITGKHFFNIVEKLFENPNKAAFVQASCLAVLTIGTLIYTIKRQYIKTYFVKNKFACCLIGLSLGMCSSFLGIGGGPINLIVLSFFFSMDIKKAALNSLYITLFGQIASILFTILTNRVPNFNITSLIVMIFGGVFGGIVGRKLSFKVKNETIEKLFILVMIFIIAVSIFNAFQYSI